MWEAPIAAVEERLNLPGSKARARGALGVREFKRLGRQVWPRDAMRWHIFIDESGPFGGIGQFPSVSLIGALTVPDTRLASLEKQYKRLRPNLPKDKKGEVKGHLLNEQQVDSVLSLLLADSALF